MMTSRGVPYKEDQPGALCSASTFTLDTRVRKCTWLKCGASDLITQDVKYRSPAMFRQAMYGVK